MRSGFALRGPTYPMIPHTAYEPPFGTAKSPAIATSCVGGRSTELSSNEVGDASTEAPCFRVILGLGQDANDRLRSGWPDEDSALLSHFPVHSRDLFEQARRQVFRGNRHVLLHLREAGHHRGGLAERAPFEGSAEEQRGGEAVAGHVVLEVDQMAGLLP